MDGRVGEILISRDKIELRVQELAQQISSDIQQDEDLVIVPILSGAIIFLADLIRYLPLRIKIGMLTVSSYPGRTTDSKTARITQPLATPIADRNVLVLDDILDSGKTLSVVCTELVEQRPKSLKTCVLLRKPTQIAMDFPVDYVGFDIPDAFVIGYGLDYDDDYRNLPDIAILEQTAGP